MSDPSSDGRDDDGRDGRSDFLGYHDDDPQKRREQAPVVLRLGISQTRLPEKISHLYIRRLYSKKALAERSEKAFDAFGRPGRGLKPVSGAFDALSEALGWGPHLRARRLADDWPNIVGASIAAYTRVASYRDGVLVVTVTDTAWTQILRSMEPAILAKVNDWMAPTRIERLILRGPGSGTRTRGGLRVRRKGVRVDRPTPMPAERAMPANDTSMNNTAADGTSTDNTMPTQKRSRKTSSSSSSSRSHNSPHNGWKDPGWKDPGRKNSGWKDPGHGGASGHDKDGSSDSSAWGGEWG